MVRIDRTTDDSENAYQVVFSPVPDSLLIDAAKQAEMEAWPILILRTAEGETKICDADHRPEATDTVLALCVNSVDSAVGGMR